MRARPRHGFMHRRRARRGVEFLLSSSGGFMVHQYKLNGYDIVLDSCSGSIHVVDDVAYDLIAGYKTVPHDELARTVAGRYGIG